MERERKRMGRRCRERGKETHYKWIIYHFVISLLMCLMILFSHFSPIEWLYAERSCWAWKSRWKCNAKNTVFTLMFHFESLWKSVNAFANKIKHLLTLQILCRPEEIMKKTAHSKLFYWTEFKIISVARIFFSLSFYRPALQMMVIKISSK